MKRLCFIGGVGGDLDKKRFVGPRRLYHELALRLKDEYLIFIIRLGKKNSQRFNEGVVDITLKRSILLPFYILRAISKINPQIIHGHGSLNMGLALLLLKISCQRKTIITFTDFKKNITHNYWFLNFLNKVIVQTNYAKNRLLKEGVRESKIVVSTYGVENKFSGGKINPKIRNLSKKIVLYYGDARRERGYDLVLDAIPLLPKDIHFLICVRSKYKNIKERDVKAMKNVTIMTIKDYPCPIQEIIMSSDIIILPFISNTLEPPLTLMEVATVGKPLITSDVGGNKEVIAKKGGLALRKLNPQELASSITSFFNNPQKAKPRQFSWEETCRLIKKVYKE